MHHKLDDHILTKVLSINLHFFFHKERAPVIIVSGQDQGTQKYRLTSGLNRKLYIHYKYIHLLSFIEEKKIVYKICTRFAILRFKER